MSGVIGAIVEAWDELRVHKVRVLLALIGVAVAVTAITSVTAAVTMLQQAMTEQSDRNLGRDTTLTASMWPQGVTPGQGELNTLDDAVDVAAARYGITYYSPNVYTSLPVERGATFDWVSAQVVDPAYATITRFQVTDGRWFAASDAERLAPVLVVNQAFLDMYSGGRTLGEHATVTVGQADPVTATVVGVVPQQWQDEPPMAYLLTEHAERWLAEATSGMGGEYRFWVPPETATDLAHVLTRDLSAALPGWQVDVQPPWDDPFALDSAARWVILGVGGFALLLGGLGLLNIALVTVRYRIREIGVRRSFGATGARVFFGVLMESVVATSVAGLVGVVLSVAIVKNIPIEEIFGTTLQDKPGFPLSAALVGMACAVGVGALSGLIPAVYAVRVKVIDAIRY
jgi:putative ABC transport system permease protein